MERKPRIPRNQPDETGRIVERNFDIIPSHIDGVSLLVDHGQEPDLTRSDTRKLRTSAKVYFDRSETIKKLQKLQDEQHAELTNLAINNPHLRGVRDQNTGFEIQVTPETTDIFDEQLLSQSLGEDRSKYVHDTASITIDIDPQVVDRTKLVSSLKRMLRRRGLSTEQIAKQLKERIGLRVDKPALEKAVRSKKVTLVPGAWGKEITIWKVIPRSISSKAEIEETGEIATQTSTPQ